MSDKAVGVVKMLRRGLKGISFPDEEWGKLSVGDVIYARATLEPVDFNEEYTLPEWEKAPRYAKCPLEVSFDGAEGGAVWISDDHKEEMVAIRGPEACRELARLLIAFADGYTDEA